MGTPFQPLLRGGNPCFVRPILTSSCSCDMLAVCAAQSSSRRPHRRDRTRLVAVTDKSECERLHCCSVPSALVWFWPDGSTFGGVGNGLLDGGSTMMTDRTASRVGAARSQRNLPTPSQPARPQRTASHSVPPPPWGVPCAQTNSYDCNRSSGQKVLNWVR